MGEGGDKSHGDGPFPLSQQVDACVFRSSVSSQIEIQIFESCEVETTVQSCGLYARLLEQPGVGSPHVACSEVGFDFELLMVKLNHGLPDVVVFEVERVFYFTSGAGRLFEKT